VGYVAHIKGSGIGLYEIGEDMSFTRRPESVTGTFANRLVHWDTNQAIIGPHVIDAEGHVRTIPEMSKHRLAATMRHLSDPKNKVYFLTMEGLLFEVDLHTLESVKLFNLVEELGIKSGQPHFKSAFTAQGRIVVANNTYEEPEFLGERASGRLAEWNGRDKWNVLEKNPFVEVSGKQNPAPGSRYGNTLFATGWDNRSVILRVLHENKWTKYRLPVAGHSWEHTWNTEWMRIREAQTERYLLDVHGMFYELPPMVYGGHVWGVKPICSHLRIVPDFCYFRGMLVLAGDQTDNAVGQPQSGLWFGDIDDLHRWGKPAGWGGVWKQEDVADRTVSDPFLMTGFDQKVVHLMNDSDNEMRITLEVDFLGNGEFRKYESFELKPRAYLHHEFPRGFSAHWVRAVMHGGGKATVWFVYN
jgi:hypothetical protein